MLDYPGVPNIMTKVFKGGRASFKEEVRGNEVRVKHEELGTQPVEAGEHMVSPLVPQEILQPPLKTHFAHLVPRVGRHGFVLF